VSAGSIPVMPKVQEHYPKEEGPHHVIIEHWPNSGTVVVYLFRFGSNKNYFLKCQNFRKLQQREN